MKIVSVAILLLVSNFIFADFWKELDKGLTVIEEIAVPERSYWPTGNYKVECINMMRNRPEKFIIQFIGSKRGGNAALAVKNLPPRWNLDEPHPLDSQDKTSDQQSTS